MSICLDFLNILADDGIRYTKQGCQIELSKQSPLIEGLIDPTFKRVFTERFGVKSMSNMGDIFNGNR